MKTYIFTEEYKKARYGSSKVSQRIYKVVNNVPDLVCIHEYNTGSCKGAESEVFTALYTHNEITESEYNTYNGYYVSPSVSGKNKTVTILKV